MNESIDKKDKKNTKKKEESVELYSLVVSFSASPVRVSTPSNCWLLFIELVRDLKHHPSFCSPEHVPFVYRLRLRSLLFLPGGNVSIFRECFNLEEHAKQQFLSIMFCPVGTINLNKLFLL